MGDIEIQARGGNIGSGQIDWVVKRGTVSIITLPKDVLLQAVFKSLITSPMNSGYGVGIPDFIGTKYVIPVRVGAGMRMLRSLDTLSSWYGRNINLKSFGVDMLSPMDSMRVSFDIEMSKGEALIGW